MKNIGTAASAATNVNFYLGTTKVGTATVGALAAGATATVTASIGTQTAGTLLADRQGRRGEHDRRAERANNNYTNPTSLVVAPVQSADLVGTPSWTPTNPSPGNSVTFTVALKNQGNDRHHQRFARHHGHPAGLEQRDRRHPDRLGTPARSPRARRGT